MKKAAVHIPNRVMNFRNQNLWVNTRAQRGSVYVAKSRFFILV